MSNVIPMPLQNLDMCLADVESLADAMLYMHEAADPNDIPRVAKATIPMLYLLMEKARAAQASSNALHRVHYRRAG